MSHKPITVFRLRIVLGRIIGIVHGVEKTNLIGNWKGLVASNILWQKYEENCFYNE